MRLEEKISHFASEEPCSGEDARGRAVGMRGAGKQKVGRLTGVEGGREIGYFRPVFRGESTLSISDGDEGAQVGRAQGEQPLKHAEVFVHWVDAGRPVSRSLGLCRGPRDRNA